MASERTGFHPIGTMSGSPWQGSLKEFPVVAASADIFIGDVVCLTAAGGVNSANAVGVTAITNIVGVMVSKVPATRQDPNQINLDHSNTDPASETLYSAGAGTVLVCTAPDTIYEVDGDEALTAAAVGQTANISPVAGNGGNTLTGKSGMQLDATTGALATAPFKIIAKPKGADVYANRVHVVCANHMFAGQLPVGI